MFVGFLYTLVLSLVPFFAMFIPRKGRVLSIAVFMVEFKEGCFEFKTSRKEVAVWGLGMTVNVSST